MVSPISGINESAAVRFTANASNQPNATSRAILNITSELQRQVNRYGRNATRTVQSHIPSPCTRTPNAFIALKLMIRKQPEAAINVLRLLCRELAPEKHGLAQLYKALETGNPNHLPEASQLTADLDKVCAVDSMPSKKFVIDALDQLISRFIQPARQTIQSGDNFDPQQLLKLVDLSVVLLKSLGKLSDNSVTTIGALNTAHLEQLGALYNAALQMAPLQDSHATILTLRNLLDRKRNAILTVQDLPLELEHMEEISRNDRDVVLTAVQRMGWSLSFTGETLKNDREVVLAAVNQNGWALGFASTQMRNDQFVVMAALQTSGIAFQFASQELRNNRDVAMAAVRQNPTALIFMSPELQRDPAIRALVFNRPQ